MIELEEDELRALSYAITYARSSPHADGELQDAMMRAMLKVSGEILREGPHYLVRASKDEDELSPYQAKRILEARLARHRANMLRERLEKA